MVHRRSKKYDAVIIGGGISGLVCGCYLAKAGMKVLIVEKNSKPGGYCSSFNRNGYFFNASSNFLTSLREGGILNRIFEELKISGNLRFNRFNPTDIIITPDYKLRFYHEASRTIDEFKENFPNEKRQIELFFKKILNNDKKIYLEYYNRTFAQLINFYFNDKRLKGILFMIPFVSTGFLPDKLSALAGCFLYREVVFDGGYYPIGGMQKLADILADRYISFGGEILLSAKAEKIIIKKDTVSGITLDSNRSIASRYVVSACDIRQVIFKLIGPPSSISGYIKKEMEKIEISLSAFLVYLGIKKNMQQAKELKSSIHIINSYDIKKIYNSILSAKYNFVSINSASIQGGLGKEEKTSICLETRAIYKPKAYWEHFIKERIAEGLIKISEKVIPGLSANIDLRITVSPYSLYKWTENYNGSAYGWANSCQQFGNKEFLKKIKIKNLYFTGHWTNRGSGIAAVAGCGYNTANLILKKN